jgi:hypothetical protein
LFCDPCPCAMIIKIFIFFSLLFPMMNRDSVHAHSETGVSVVDGQTSRNLSASASHIFFWAEVRTIHQ